MAFTISRTALVFAAALMPLVSGAQPATGWLNWRGPLGTGVSLEESLPSEWEIGGKNHLWTYDVIGGGTPVIADGRLYAFGFYGEKGEDVQETLLCLDANTGKKIWERRFSDYISDVVYNRYGIGSPTVDAETGNVYLQLSNGRCVAFTRDGEPLWEVSLMEELDGADCRRLASAFLMLFRRDGHGSRAAKATGLPANRRS